MKQIMKQVTKQISVSPELRDQLKEAKGSSTYETFLLYLLNISSRPEMNEGHQIAVEATAVPAKGLPDEADPGWVTELQAVSAIVHVLTNAELQDECKRNAIPDFILHKAQEVLFGPVEEDIIAENRAAFTAKKADVDIAEPEEIHPALPEEIAAGWDLPHQQPSLPPQGENER